MKEHNAVLVIDVDTEWNKFHEYILKKSKMTAESAKADTEYNTHIDSIKSKFIQLVTLTYASLLDRPNDKELLRKELYATILSNHSNIKGANKQNTITEFAQLQVA